MSTRRVSNEWRWDDDGPPLATVVVPALNAAGTIANTLRALAQQDVEQPFEVVVVDDGSVDDTVAVAKMSLPAVRVIEQHRQGPGPARNSGAQIARASVLAFTDADCVPTPSWLRVGLSALRQNDLIQGAVRPDPASPRGPFDHTVWVVRESGLYETANLFITRELFWRLEGFKDLLDARIGKPLAEDAWLGWRARRAGARTAFCEDAVVHHAVLERGAGAYIQERLRAGYFPLIASSIPELRDAFFWRRWFLSPRSAAFDVAALGAVLAIGKRKVFPLLLAGPYLRIAGRRALHWPRRAPVVLAADALADFVAAAALTVGSVRARTPVI